MGSDTNCYTGDEWDQSLCPDPVTCAQNCALEASDYQSTYGITTNGDALRLNFVTHGQYGDNVGSRVFLMHPPAAQASDDANRCGYNCGNPPDCSQCTVSHKEIKAN
mgnify:CR=1 FL=1